MLLTEEECLLQFHEWKEWAIPMTDEGAKIYEAQKAGWFACWEYLTKEKQNEFSNR
jgi:hypothetical protein